MSLEKPWSRDMFYRVKSTQDSDTILASISIGYILHGSVGTWPMGTKCSSFINQEIGGGFF